MYIPAIFEIAGYQTLQVSCKDALLEFIDAPGGRYNLRVWTDLADKSRTKICG
jgi:hypothetical protein